MPIHTDSIFHSSPPLSSLHTVYDVRDFSFDATNLIPLIFVFIGIGIVFYHKKYTDPNEEGRYGLSKKSSNIFGGVIFSVVALFIFLSVFLSESSLTGTMRKAYKSGDYKTVQGFVKNFHPMAASGHEDEYFDVGSVHFNYSYFAITGAYNKTATYGGFIKEGSYVQITYTNSTYITENDTHPILILKIAK